MGYSCSAILWFCSLALLSLLGPALSGSIVQELPGFPGPLPFTLETGYTTVGEIEFFYYFVPSETEPEIDPILLYMNGGPGCSGINGLFYQIGPLKFDINNYSGDLPSLMYEPDTWSKTANLIFLDAPIGAGFSYANTSAAYNTSDTLNAQQIHMFLRNWLIDHPAFQSNRVFVASDSYAGLITPMLAMDIISGNEAGLKPRIKLEGYSIGCPHTYTDLETNSRIPFAHRLALISDSLYEAAEKSCDGNYVESTNANCTEDLAAITQCIELINRQNILDPYCAFTTPERKQAFRSLMSKQRKHRRALRELTEDYLVSASQLAETPCRYFQYMLSHEWLNYPHVKDALNVRPGTTGEAFRCNGSLSGYTSDIGNVIPYHKNLSTVGLQVLVYSGDHDMMIPHNSVETWIKSLDLTVDIDWRPWYVDGQVAGYTRTYADSGYRLTYATLKGSGHSPPEYKRKECYNMFYRWVHYYPL